MTRAAYPFWKVYGAGIVLAVITLAGLLLALFGDGAWDTGSWILLAMPMVVLLWHLVKSRLSNQRNPG